MLVEWVFAKQASLDDSLLCSNNFREMNDQLKRKGEKILKQQKEIYELKLEKVEAAKQELLEKLNRLSCDG